MKSPVETGVVSYTHSKSGIQGVESEKRIRLGVSQRDYFA
jgi:hypothetical protein